jgi:hypothetical protein
MFRFDESPPWSKRSIKALVADTRRRWFSSILSTPPVDSDPMHRCTQFDLCSMGSPTPGMSDGSTPSTTTICTSEDTSASFLTLSSTVPTEAAAVSVSSARRSFISVSIDLLTKLHLTSPSAPFDDNFSMRMASNVSAVTPEAAVMSATIT